MNSKNSVIKQYGYNNIKLALYIFVNILQSEVKEEKCNWKLIFLLSLVSLYSQVPPLNHVGPGVRHCLHAKCHIRHPTCHMRMCLSVVCESKLKLC